MSPSGGTKWRKAPPELIAAFARAFPGAPAERRQMFGYPAGFINGTMFTGLHQEDWFVRLDDYDRTMLLKTPGARVFEPMPGKPMKEYVILPPSIVADPRTLKTMLTKAMEYTAKRAVKTPTGAKPKSETY